MFEHPVRLPIVGIFCATLGVKKFAAQAKIIREFVGKSHPDMEACRVFPGLQILSRSIRFGSTLHVGKIQPGLKPILDLGVCRKNTQDEQGKEED